MTERSFRGEKDSSGPSSDPDTLAAPGEARSSANREEVDSMGVTCRHISANETVVGELRQGTSVSVCLPGGIDVPHQMFGDSRAEPLMGGNETVLVVEDEEIVLNWAREALQLLGYSALSAQDPRDAITISHTHTGPIHLLLTDVVLPRVDGRSLYERLLESRPGMKVIYMSGYASSLLEHYKVGIADPHFLQKPFALESLAKKIREALAESEKAQHA
jgi:two-component system, cell cycle sensor histidine kinase and response regulator CckA